MSIIKLPVLFLTDLVALPGMVMPIELDDAARAAVDAARSHSDGHLLVAPRLEDRYASYGVEASILQMGRLASGEPAAVIRAERRVRIGSGVSGPGTALWVEAEVLDSDGSDSEEVRKLAAEYKALVIATLQRRDAWQVIDTVNKVTDPSTLADLAGYAPYLTDDRKRQLLETPKVAERLRTLIEWTKAHIAETEVSDKIADDVREGMEKSQREFLLRQQLNAIRKELGEDEPDGAQDYRARVETADLPADVRKAALREVGKLERASDQNPESGYIRTWLDTVLDLPWAIKTTDSTDINAAREVLDADHHGLEDVKDRIVEYLAIRARRASRGLEIVGGRGSGAVLALVGPPGVGKTSLGESVARALGRKFVRVALGGIRDEAEIRGHRRTYVGAMPGRVIKALKDAKSRNPVMVLDEIDKVGSDAFRGDPSSALLEVLDPEQNTTFSDHYLEVPFDLSKVIFITTANLLEPIPPALRDRMEIIEVSGYTEVEKMAIGRQFLLPKTLETHGLAPEQLTVTDDALRRLIREYTEESGVRNLEREIGSLCRKVARILAGDDPPPEIVVDAPQVSDYLGIPKYDYGLAEEQDEVGVATGAAVTSVGGDLLGIEVLIMPGKGDLILTGQLGDVMQESARAALSYARARTSDYGLAPDFFDRHNIHVHVPAGAIPKDGPSAGITMATALISALTGRQVRKDVAMTGEITLRGKVLPIGGLREKTVAAHRGGIKTFILPRRNAKDLAELPGVVRNGMELIQVDSLEQVLAAALLPKAQTGPVPVQVA